MLGRRALAVAKFLRGAGSIDCQPAWDTPAARNAPTRTPVVECPPAVPSAGGS